MTDSAPAPPGRFTEIRTIYNIVQVTPGLPMPFTGPDRAAFWFTHIPAEDARNAVTTARLVFADAFGVTFTPRLEQASNGPRRVYQALLPSGFAITLWVKAEDAEDPRTPASGDSAPQLARAAA